ncbi:hypothetical protein llap_7672 [Limosa lapponica baueri]|uniref:Uncharacterized protein n=1 Tax=Limosa lapponica baueri TaxID=1758121 RepID=A0A2I0U7H8_LIMLA|nr:hypothetical protein llap_7672 [Limosa lapponica baueri]
MTDKSNQLHVAREAEDSGITLHMYQVKASKQDKLRRVKPKHTICAIPEEGVWEKTHLAIPVLELECRS